MTMMHTNGANGIARAAEGRDVDASIIERVIAAGDLSRLQPQERTAYYVAVCRSVGLNPLTKPFDYIQLNGKLTLYATKNCTDQLRQNNAVSVLGTERVTIDGIHVVTAKVCTASGRTDEDIGAVNIKGLTGEALANALMKATTKAKRRATLSICGLSFVDESELETIPGARRVTVDQDGVILDGPGVVHNAPVMPNLELFAQMCDRVDAAESLPELNAIAADAKKALKAGLLSASHIDQIKSALTRKKGLIGAAPPPPPPSDMNHDGDTGGAA